MWRSRSTNLGVRLAELQVRTTVAGYTRLERWATTCSGCWIRTSSSSPEAPLAQQVGFMGYRE
jgi:hypothetical protein